MDIILNDELDHVAVEHEEAELILCLGCSKDYREANKHFDDVLTRNDLKALDVGTYDRCDCCNSLLLDLAEE